MSFFPSNFNYYYKINPKYTFINNNLTGAVDFIEGRFWDFFISGEYEKIPIEILENLFDRGYIYKNTDKEKYFLKKLFKNFLKIASKNIKRFVFVPTYYCNLSCTYCFENNLNQDNIIFSDAILKKAFEIIKKINPNNNYKIELYGGEPLLPKTKKIINKIISFSLISDSKVTIISNGIYIKKFISLLLQIHNNIEMIQVTLDGIKDINDSRRKFKSGKGTFLIISKNISTLLENGINVCLRVNIDNSNIDYIVDFYNYLLKTGWLKKSNFDVKLSLVADHRSSVYKNNIVTEEELLKKLINLYDRFPQLEKTFKYYAFKQVRNIINILEGAPNNSPRFFNCEANILEYIIFCPDGYLYTCPESIGNKEFAIGMFYPEFSFFKDNKIKWISRNIYSIKKCSSCSFSPICGGGCNYAAFIQNKTEPVCERFNEVLDTFFKLRGEKILKSHGLM